MARAKASGMFGRQKISKWTTHRIAESTPDMMVRTFLRFTDYGIVVVTCYLSNDVGEPPETMVRMCNGGYSYWRWYEHGVVTERGAAMLVNRFLADWHENQSE